MQRSRERILRYLEKRGVITFAADPGHDEVNAVLGEGFGESDPLLSTLLDTATLGSPPAVSPGTINWKKKYFVATSWGYP